MATEFRIRRFDDATIFQKLKSAQRAGDQALEDAIDQKTELTGSKHRIRLTLSTGLPWQIQEAELGEAPAGQFILEGASLTFEVNVKAPNGTRTDTVKFNFSRGGNNALIDTLVLDGGQRGQPNEAMTSPGAQSVLRAIHRELSSLLQPVAPEDGGLIPTLSNLAEGFGTTYQRISAELSDAVSKVSEERTNQINEFVGERERLREQMTEERDKMLQAAQKELDERRDALAAESSRIEQARAQLEISSHKDARRRQFQTLQQDLAAAMGKPVASGDLRATRWAVFLALVVAGVAASVFAYASIVAGSSPSGSSANGEWVFTAIRSVVLSIASLGAFVGAAAWLRYFYVRDLQAQESLQRFGNDMARASWIMDAALEIRKEHNEEIPPEWLSGVTEGLFKDGGTQATIDEGAQALAALLGLTASARFGADGVSVELNRKGRRKVAQAGHTTGET